MTYVLTCLLCAVAPGDLAAPGATFATTLTLRLPDAARPGDLDPAALRLRQTASLSFSDTSPDGHSGHDGSDHMGPMWIMMGVMMVGMMVALGAYMMRGHWATPLDAAAVGAPHQAAIPPAVAFRPGG